MTKKEVEKIAAADRHGDSDENMQSPNQVNIAVGMLNSINIIQDGMETCYRRMEPREQSTNEKISP